MGKRWWVATLIGGIILLGITEHKFLAVCHPHWQMFLKELGFAAIIASVFGATIERYQREEFVRLVNREREDLKRDVFLYAYGHDVAEEIREEIKERVLKQPLHRTGLHLEWEFSESAKPDFVNVEKRYTFIIHNNSALEQTYPFRFRQITAAEKEILAETKLLSLKIQDRNGSHEFSQDDLKEERDPLNPPKQYAWKISEGIFPYQGIAISWSPTKKDQAQSYPKKETQA